MERPAVADYPAGARLPTRVIDDYELVWMLRGRAVLVLDDDEAPLVPGNVVLVPPGVRHGFVWDTRRPSRHGYVHFSQRDVSEQLPLVPRFQRMTQDDPLAGLCGYLLWLGAGEQASWQDRGREALGLLVALLVSGPLPDPEATGRLHPAMSSVVTHLRERWSGSPTLRRVSVGELADAALVSRGYLNRLFRDAFGLPASETLQLVRCARAEALLSRTDLTLESIAAQTGFADLSHFSHRFTALYGMAPSVYRASAASTPSALDHPGVRRLTRLIWR